MVLWRSMPPLFLAFVIMSALVLYPVWEHYRWPIFSPDFYTGMTFGTSPRRIADTIPQVTGIEKSLAPAFPNLQISPRPENPFAPQPTPMEDVVPHGLGGFLTASL